MYCSLLNLGISVEAEIILEVFGYVFCDTSNLNPLHGTKHKKSIKRLKEEIKLAQKSPKVQ